MVVGERPCANHVVRLDTDVIHALSLRGDKIQEAWIFSLNQDDFDEFWAGR